MASKRVTVCFRSSAVLIKGEKNERQVELELPDTLCVLAIAIGLIGLACGGSTPQGNTNTSLGTPTPDPCAPFTDEVIVNMIYGKLIKDRDIFPQIKQINIYAISGAVTLLGWVDTAALSTKVIDIVKNISPCVKSVDSSKFYDHAPGPPLQWSPSLPGNGCGQGLVRCGDLCVPDHCFWPVDAPSPVPTSTNRG